MKRSLDILVSVLVSVVVLGALAVAAAWLVSGWIPIVITGGSMEPGIDRGSLAFVQELDARDVKAGDVITFTPPQTGKRLTHRVVSASTRQHRSFFVTKGDANEKADTWPSRTTGHSRRTSTKEFSYANDRAYRYVFSVPVLGRAYAEVVRIGHHAIVLYGGLALLLTYMLVGIWRPTREREPERERELVPVIGGDVERSPDEEPVATPEAA